MSSDLYCAKVLQRTQVDIVMIELQTHCGWRSRLFSGCLPDRAKLSTERMGDCCGSVEADDRR